MKRSKDTSLPDRPDGERWRIGYSREMTPTEASIELIEMASEFPSGPEGEAFRRAVVLAVNALKATDVVMLPGEPDRNIGGRCLVPGAVIASVRAWLPTVAESDPDAVVKGDALFKPWLEKVWLPTSPRRVRADIFYAAVSIVFPGVEKRCKASGHSLYGLRVKPGAAVCEGDKGDALNDFLDVARFAFARCARDVSAVVAGDDLFRAYRTDAETFRLKSSRDFFWSEFHRLFPELVFVDGSGGYPGVRLKTTEEVDRDAGQTVSPNALRPIVEPSNG